MAPQHLTGFARGIAALQLLGLKLQVERGEASGKKRGKKGRNVDLAARFPRGAGKS